MRLNKLLPLAALFLACQNGEPSTPNPDPVEPPSGPVARSARGNLRFKGPERINSDFAAALGLSAETVCSELGQYPCATVVHNVALGGVDPYGPGLYEAAGVTASTTPLVIDRIAWAACTLRVNSDLATPAAAAIFKDIPQAGKKLANPDGSEVRGVITQLTQRALLRNPYRNELERYIQLAKDIEATGNSEPAKSWMQSVCFAVLSSAESIFY